MTNQDLTKTDLAILRTLVKGDLQSMLELPAYDRRESCYQEEYLQILGCAERLGVKLGKLPKQLKASAKQAAEARAKDEAYRADLKRLGPRFMR
jgi:hypothetical protein